MEMDSKLEIGQDEHPPTTESGQSQLRLSEQLPAAGHTQDDENLHRRSIKIGEQEHLHDPTSDSESDQDDMNEHHSFESAHTQSLDNGKAEELDPQNHSMKQEDSEDSDESSETDDAGSVEENDISQLQPSHSDPQNLSKSLQPPVEQASRPHTQELDDLEMPQLVRQEPAAEAQLEETRPVSTSTEESDSSIAESESESDSDDSLQEVSRTRTPRGSLASNPAPATDFHPETADLELASGKSERSEPEQMDSGSSRSSVSSQRTSLPPTHLQTKDEEARTKTHSIQIDPVDHHLVGGEQPETEPHVAPESTLVTVEEEEEVTEASRDTKNWEPRDRLPTTATLEDVPEETDSADSAPILEPSKPPVQPGIVLGELSTPAAESVSKAKIRSRPHSPIMQHDSMVTVRLSEPSNFGQDVRGSVINDDGSPLASEETAVAKRPVLDTIETTDLAPRASIITLAPTQRGSSPLQDERLTSRGERGSSDSEEEVDWDNLERTEGEQTKDEDTDNSTALLLARLDEENAKLAGNPKTVKVTTPKSTQGKRPRPPSMAQLRQMIDGPTPPALRYSLVPPPPMTDLEFYAALVKDYQQTAARLPTLLSNKIRKGIPPPLRGVVWQSMSGARDPGLVEQYERLSGESSPYEPIIGKDLGRSFPGVDMFRETDGDGQRMLGRVLKAFSLYDTKIGYCQGLAFLVGPLLMHMPDRDAFCVLVRLMERYDLRTCFLPDLSGLHVKIYQFRELLRLNLPSLASHLEHLQVDPAYVSQWFLSFFAVTCPLPFLFRLYDVVFAEGATETLMRVALSLMRKNEPRLLACTELEDVMGLLLSRGLWDCYSYNADEFVQDFVSLTNEVSRERLSQLEQGYKDSLVATTNAVRSSAITNAATRFLGRIWAASSVVPPRTSSAATLSPTLNNNTHTPLGMLRRSGSKQSLTSTLNSIEATSASTTSLASTDVTNLSRDSAPAISESLSRESTPVGTKASAAANTNTTEERYLHSQIEDLLTALSELQRNNAVLSNQLQRAREERDEDKRTVRSLLDGLRRRAGYSEEGEGAAATALTEDGSQNPKTPPEQGGSGEPLAADTDTPSTQDLTELLDRVESRFVDDEERDRRSSWVQTKAQLREDLTRAREQLSSVTAQSEGLSHRLEESDAETRRLREQLRESHTHVRNLHQDKQRLERQIQGMRSPRMSVHSAMEPSSKELDTEWPGKIGNSSSNGLRELKLARSVSTPSQPGGAVYNKRLSSLSKSRDSVIITPPPPSTPPQEQDNLLSELVQAKTAEAMAKQEAEEAKQKLEAFKKAYGIVTSTADSSSLSSAPASPPTSTGVLSMFGRLTGQEAALVAESGHKPSASASGSTSGTNSGGFWGWRR